VEGPLSVSECAVRGDEPGDDAGAFVEILRVAVAGERLALDGDRTGAPRASDRRSEHLVAETQLPGVGGHPHLIDPDELRAGQVVDEFGHEVPDEDVADVGDDHVDLVDAVLPPIPDQRVFEQPSSTAALIDQRRPGLDLELAELCCVAGVGSPNERIDHVASSCSSLPRMVRRCRWLRS
jgi:hypothetical protein